MTDGHTNDRASELARVNDRASELARVNDRASELARVKWAMPVATLVLGLALGSMQWVRPAQAQNAGTVECVTVAGGGFAVGKGEKGLEEERPLLVANFQAVAPLAERWAAGQIAEGRKNFFSSTVAVNASVLCAW